MLVNCFETIKIGTCKKTAPTTEGVKKPHRYRSGTIAIRYLFRSGDCLLNTNIHICGTILCGGWVDHWKTIGPKFSTFRDNNYFHDNSCCGFHVVGRNIQLLQRINARVLLFNSCCKFLCTYRSSIHIR